MIKIGILGSTGYTGLELIKYFVKNKNVVVKYVTSNRYCGKKYSEVHTAMQGIFDMVMINNDDAVNIDVDAAFLALPHTVSFNYVPLLLEKNIKVIDLSADYRFISADDYEKHYGVQHNDKQNLKKAVYGIPEINYDDIKSAELLANPGCYPTSAIIPLYPLLKEKIISNYNIFIDAKSGVSGAGRKAADNLIYCEVAEDFKPYNILYHRHKPEIDEKLLIFSGNRTDVVFVPYLLPLKQGMFTTVYTKLNDYDLQLNYIKDVYNRYYSDSKYVRFRQNLPRISDVVNTNFIDINFTVFNDNLIIFSAIDNLIKGASGQAVQNFNIMFGLDDEM